MAPGSQEATFLSEDEHEEGESSTWWTSPSLHKRYGGPGKQYPYEKTGGLEPGRFKPIEEPGAEEKDPLVS
jgi:hypothetical protein